MFWVIPLDRDYQEAKTPAIQREKEDHATEENCYESDSSTTTPPQGETPREAKSAGLTWVGT